MGSEWLSNRLRAPPGDQPDHVPDKLIERGVDLVVWFGAGVGQRCPAYPGARAHHHRGASRQTRIRPLRGSQEPVLTCLRELIQAIVVGLQQPAVHRFRLCHPSAGEFLA